MQTLLDIARWIILASLIAGAAGIGVTVFFAFTDKRHAGWTLHPIFAAILALLVFVGCVALTRPLWQSKPGCGCLVCRCGK